MKTFNSNYSNELEAFLNQKRAIGNKYIAEEAILLWFDKFCLQHTELCVLSQGVQFLPKTLVEEFAKKREHETWKTVQTRSTVIREFGKFLVANGTNAYVLKPIRNKSSSQFKPYIFTKEEVGKFFATLDTLKKSNTSPMCHLVLPALFKMLYGCGLRIAEATHLKIADVDLDNATLTVKQAKFGNSRLVSMSKSLVKVLQKYVESMPKNRPPEMPFFINLYDKKVSHGSVYDMFRNTLVKINISHGGRGNGPRLHDFRHTFAVHSMQQLIEQGYNIYTIAPVLGTYLGHKSLAATQKYLRITAANFPQISTMLEEKFGNIIKTSYKMSSGNSIKA